MTSELEENYHSILFPYAYNILGSVEEAKDAIHDVLLRHIKNGVTPDNEKNYLIKGVINQSLSRKRALKRVQNTDHWLPEPVAVSSSDVNVELRQLVSYSLLYLMERLNPKERAVFILKEAFSYTHEEIAESLSISIDNSRKIFSRANDKLSGYHRSQHHVQAGQAEQVEHFVTAIRNRDLNRLHELLSEDIAFYADGGNKVKVVEKFCTGLEKVADLLVYVHDKYQRNYTTKPVSVNHQPALLYYYRDQLILCQIFEFDKSDKISSVSVILDPAKIQNLSASF